jgi:type I restriction enzyme R subunit
MELRDGGELVNADLEDIEKSHGISAANILFPILNFLSADDIGILHREFNSKDGYNDSAPLTFDDIRLRALEERDNNWANSISIRWRLANFQLAHRGGIHGN